MNIFDTCGLEGISETILKFTITNRATGVIILCMDMYEQLHKSTLEALAQLHKRFGWKFWLHVVIVLTKADCYEEHKWLRSKSESETVKNFLTIKFAEELEKQKTILRKAFTATADQALPRCHIGMTEREFDDVFKIPIIPTSQLNQHALERMEQVGHGYWFDILLIKCCQRLRAQPRGCWLQVHRDRLSQLPPELSRQELSRAEYRWFMRNRRMSADFQDPLTHQRQTSSVTKPRFE